MQRAPAWRGVERRGAAGCVRCQVETLKGERVACALTVSRALAVGGRTHFSLVSTEISLVQLKFGYMAQTKLFWFTGFAAVKAAVSELLLKPDCEIIIAVKLSAS